MKRPINSLRFAAIATACLTLSCHSDPAPGPGGNEPPPGSINLRVETIASGLRTVWELALAQDGKIWFTERGGTISYVDPSSKVVTRVGNLPVIEQGESGLLGFALHPDFPSQPFLFVMYSYGDGAAGTLNRLVRLRYTGTALTDQLILVDAIPGSFVHDGSRVVVGPDRLLYVTTGDASVGSRSQDLTSLAGKTLRLTLDGQPAPANPFGTLVYSYGHRNSQGLVFMPDGSMYQTEHGADDNDEVNRVIAGGNYGWPSVHGRCDDNIPGEIAFCASHQTIEPIASWTPTIAPAAIAYYNSDLISQWKGSLLFLTLKDEALYQLSLSSEGTNVTHENRFLANRFGRLRALLVAPDGAVYLSTSNMDGRGTHLLTDDKILRLQP